ncbi:LAMP1_2 [Mytilus coruscus]|uniref:Lysosome-associated membrane glycoprotein 5 n=1 Tax=Mytilus coruscus TaxID=42192 RepID=A0A6J8EMN3_MYTCO|nr:LAMP1_2 [Mytilus coruscus]
MDKLQYKISSDYVFPSEVTAADCIMNGFGISNLLLIGILFVISGCKGFQYPESAPCIIVNMDATIQLTQLGTQPVEVTSSLNSSKVDKGFCPGANGSASNIILQTTAPLPARITLLFSKDGQSVVSMDITVTFDPDVIFNNTDEGNQVLADVGNTRLSKDTSSYKCDEQQTILFNKKNSSMYTYEFKMTVRNVVIQAFNIVNGTLSEAEECAADGTTVAPTSTETIETTQPDVTNTGSTTTMATTDETTVLETTSFISTPTETTPEGTSNTPITPRPDDPPIQSYSAHGENGTCVLIQCGIQFEIHYNTTNQKYLLPRVVGYITNEQIATLFETYETDLACNLDEFNRKVARWRTRWCITPRNQMPASLCETLDAQASKIIGVPERVIFDGSCNQPNNTQSLQIQFYDNWDLRLTFSQFDDRGRIKFYLSDIDLTANLSKELFPDIDNPIFRQNIKTSFATDTITASTEGSYRCTKEAAFLLKDGTVMSTFNLQYAAFQKNITVFSESGISECSSDVETSSVIPIAVGSALGGLIVIVLVAYAIGRRCKEKGDYDTI